MANQLINGGMTKGSEGGEQLDALYDVSLAHGVLPHEHSQIPEGRQQC